MKRILLLLCFYPGLNFCTHLSIYCGKVNRIDASQSLNQILLNKDTIRKLGVKTNQFVQVSSNHPTKKVLLQVKSANEGQVSLNQRTCEVLQVSIGDDIFIDSNPVVSRVQKLTLIPFENSIARFNNDLNPERILLLSQLFKVLHSGNSYLSQKNKTIVTFNFPIYSLSAGINLNF